MQRSRRAAEAVVAVLTASVLAACSVSGQPSEVDTEGATGSPPAVLTATPAPTEPRAESPASTAEPDPPEELTPTRDPLITLEDQVGARSELRDFVCEAEEGAWSAQGLVQNPTDQPVVYVVNVGVIERESRSSLVRRNIVLETDPGQEVAFDELDLLTSDRADLECVVRVNRGSGVQNGG